MVSSAPAVELCMLLYQTLENENIDALKQNHSNFEARMELSASAKSDLQCWVDNIQQSEKKISPPNPDIVITTNASKQGWGAVRDHHTTGGRWSPAEAEKHLNELELQAVFFASCSLCDNVRNKHIRILSDNTTTVCYINNMGGSISRACNIIAKIWQFALERYNFLSSAHLPGKQNMLADRESSMFNDQTEWILHQDIFQKLSLLWGPFEIDLFASRLNKQVCTYLSRKPDPGATAVDAFSIIWDRKPFYAFPPFSPIHRCLQKITADKAEGVIIVPMWPTQTHYPGLMSMLIQWPRLLPRKENPLRLPHSQKSHLLWTKMQLMACLVSGIALRQKEFWKNQEKLCCSHGENLPGTSVAYISKKWTTFCVKGTLIHMTSVNNVLKFLTLLYESGLGYSSINTAHSALSSLHCGSTCLVGNHPLICRFMRGVYISRPTQSHYTIVWDVKVVLDYFRQWKDNEELSLNELSLKTTTLVALASAQRVQSLHKLDLDCMTQENDRIAFKFDVLKQSRPSVKSPIIELCAYP